MELLLAPANWLSSLLTIKEVGIFQYVIAAIFLLSGLALGFAPLYLLTKRRNPLYLAAFGVLAIALLVGVTATTARYSVWVYTTVIAIFFFDLARILVHRYSSKPLLQLWRGWLVIAAVASLIVTLMPLSQRGSSDRVTETELKSEISKTAQNLETLAKQSERVSEQVAASPNLLTIFKNSDAAASIASQLKVDNQLTYLTIANTSDTIIARGHLPLNQTGVLSVQLPWAVAAKEGRVISGTFTDERGSAISATARLVKDGEIDRGILITGFYLTSRELDGVSIVSPKQVVAEGAISGREKLLLEASGTRNVLTPHLKDSSEVFFSVSKRGYEDLYLAMAPVKGSDSNLGLVAVASKDMGSHYLLTRILSFLVIVGSLAAFGYYSIGKEEK